MIISKRQKLAVLAEALSLIESNKFKFMCNAIVIAYRITQDASIGGRKNVLKFFPELLKYKPDDATDVDPWFPPSPYGRRRRIEILNEVIENLSK